MKICLYGASSDKVKPACFTAVEELGRQIAERGHILVFGGGNSGMMGASARGAKSSGGKVIGISPAFFNVDGVLFPHSDELILTETMHERKMLLRDHADAFAVTPGGIGTLDEFFEVLTLRQLGCHFKPIGLLNVDGCFDSLLRMLDEMIADGYMKADCRELYGVFETPAALLDYLETPIPEGEKDPGKYKFLRYGVMEK